MYYVYLLRSIPNPDQTYIGYTSDLKRRLLQHNSSNTYYTSDHKHWKLVTYIAFDSQEKAIDFEKYLKGGSGYVFAQRRFW